MIRDNLVTKRKIKNIIEKKRKEEKKKQQNIYRCNLFCIVLKSKLSQRSFLPIHVLDQKTTTTTTKILPK